MAAPADHLSERIDRDVAAVGPGVFGRPRLSAGGHDAAPIALDCRD